MINEYWTFVNKHSQHIQIPQASLKGRCWESCGSIKLKLFRAAVFLLRKPLLYSMLPPTSHGEQQIFYDWSAFSARNQSSPLDRHFSFDASFDHLQIDEGWK